MDSKDKLMMLEKNPEIAKSLEEALRSNADEKELADILDAANIDAKVADDLLAECQRRRGTDIGFESVDPEALKIVAGGNEKLGGCAEKWYEQECYSSVEANDWCWSNDHCILFSKSYSVYNPVTDEHIYTM